MYICVYRADLETGRLYRAFGQREEAKKKKKKNIRATIYRGHANREAVRRETFTERLAVSKASHRYEKHDNVSIGCGMSRSTTPQRCKTLSDCNLRAPTLRLNHHIVLDRRIGLTVTPILVDE